MTWDRSRTTEKHARYTLHDYETLRYIVHCKKATRQDATSGAGTQLRVIFVDELAELANLFADPPRLTRPVLEANLKFAHRNLPRLAIGIRSGRETRYPHRRRRFGLTNNLVLRLLDSHDGQELRRVINDLNLFLRNRTRPDARTAGRARDLDDGPGLGNRRLRLFSRAIQVLIEKLR